MTKHNVNKGLIYQVVRNSSFVSIVFNERKQLLGITYCAFDTEPHFKLEFKVLV